MNFSEELKDIKKRNPAKGNIIEEWNTETRHYAPSKYCKNEFAKSLGQCQTCGYCGREFDSSGKLISSEIEEADEKIFTATKND